MSQHHAHPDSNDPRVHRITEARESHSAERDVRVRNYTITMSVRVICFILAFFASGWLRWVFLVGAVFLPYIAVVLANGGADITKREPPAEFYTPTDPAMLEPGGPDRPNYHEASEVIDGSLADDADDQGEPGPADEPNPPKES